MDLTIKKVSDFLYKHLVSKKLKIRDSLSNEQRKALALAKECIEYYDSSTESAKIALGVGVEPKPSFPFLMDKLRSAEAACRKVGISKNDLRVLLGWKYREIKLDHLIFCHIQQ
jgi:hypothetical protein